jgi:hypothetical protein
MDVSALSCPVVVTSKCMFFRHFFITVLLCSFLPTDLSFLHCLAHLLVILHALLFFTLLRLAVIQCAQSHAQRTQKVDSFVSFPSREKT